MRRHLLWLCPLILTAGCGGGGSGTLPTSEGMDQIALGDVGEIYRLYTATKKKPPEKFADFQGMELANPTGYQALKTGAVVLCYGATMTEAELEGPAKTGSDEVLAYNSQVPQSGGKVLMLDRTIKTMTAGEFKAAKLSGKEASAPSTSKKG